MHKDRPLRLRIGGRVVSDFAAVSDAAVAEEEAGVGSEESCIIFPMKLYDGGTDEFLIGRFMLPSMRVFTNNEDPSTSRSSLGKSFVNDDIDCRDSICAAEGSGASWSITKDEPLKTVSSGSRNQESLDGYEKSRSKNDSTPSTSKQGPEPNWKSQVGKKHQTYSGPIIPSIVHSNSFSERGHMTDRSESEHQLANEKHKRDVRKAPNFSGPLMLPTRASANSLSAPMRSSAGYGDSLEDKSKFNVVQIKGRFSVTSENVDLVKDIPICSVPRRSSQGSPLRKSASVGDWLVQSKQVLTNSSPKEHSSSVPASILMPHLQNLFQQTSFQQDLIMNLLNSLQQNDLVDAPQPAMSHQTGATENDVAETATTERERLLLLRIVELQARMVSLTDELTAEKLKHNRLQEQLNAINRLEDIEEF